MTQPEPGGLVRWHVRIAYINALFWVAGALIHWDNGWRWTLAALALLAAFAVHLRVTDKHTRRLVDEALDRPDEGPR